MNNSIQFLDDKAVGSARNLLRTEAELLVVLAEMKRRNLFVPLGYLGVFDYCERRLSFSYSQCHYFKSVVEKSVEVPALKAAVVSGEITLSQARRIAPVVDKENLFEWVAKAKSLPQKELEREVTAVNPKAHIHEKIKPVARELSELRVAVDSRTEAGLNALKEILSQKLKRSTTLQDVIAWSVEVTREKFDPIRKAERSKKISSRKSTVEPVRKLKPGRRPIPAPVKHQVMLRDQGQCTYVSPDGQRCVQKRWLHHHHLTEVTRGGLNTPANLRLLCQVHHKWAHAAAVGLL